ncbi:LytTR family transcriptional regulator DNA-binding domain-containing protein [uncultured Thomasclavelia sp.]|uniref:LytTR family transcriptional regulator DNA-binding domain-containing protein n=1 Tax=Thomasclavelia ramosa TaxID=1547 RepID=UPI0035A38631
MSKKLSQLLDELAVNQFIQVHKRYIVNQNHIVIRKSNEIVLKNKIAIPIGRKFKNTN